MRSKETKLDRVIVARIHPNEDLIDEITKIARLHEIKGGLINVIGAFKKVTLGYFDLRSKDYEFKTLEEDVELWSAMGNLSRKDGEPIIHLHVMVGKKDYSILGGHLGQPSIISVTGEVYIYEVNQEIQRAQDPQFGLSLLDL